MTAMLIAVMLAAPSLLARSLQATPAAAFNGSSRALELHLGEPGSSEWTDAYVAIGSDRGIRAETALTVAFDLDLRDLVTTKARATALRFLRLSETKGPDGARLVISLEPDGDGWLIAAWSRERSEKRLVRAGRAPLPLRHGADGRSATVRVEVEWAASAAAAGHGHLRLSALSPDGERIPLVESEALDNAGQLVNRVEFGVLAADGAPGIFGRLRLDDFAVDRPARVEP